jgi:hypothetical protein
MLWHRDLHLDDLPLPWARAENTRHGNVYIRPARGYPWPLVFLDDVAEDLASRIARKYDTLVAKTSQEGGCHIWLSCSCSLDECERHQAQRWLAPLAGADTASTSGEHLGPRRLQKLETQRDLGQRRGSLTQPSPLGTSRR